MHMNVFIGWFSEIFYLNVLELSSTMKQRGTRNNRSDGQNKKHSALLCFGGVFQSNAGTKTQKYGDVLQRLNHSSTTVTFKIS